MKVFQAISGVITHDDRGLTAPSFGWSDSSPVWWEPFSWRVWMCTWVYTHTYVPSSLSKMTRALGSLRKQRCRCVLESPWFEGNPQNEEALSTGSLFYSKWRVSGHFVTFLPVFISAWDPEFALAHGRGWKSSGYVLKIKRKDVSAILTNHKMFRGPLLYMGRCPA